MHYLSGAATALDEPIPQSTDEEEALLEGVEEADAGTEWQIQDWMSYLSQTLAIKPPPVRKDVSSATAFRRQCSIGATFQRSPNGALCVAEKLPGGGLASCKEVELGDELKAVEGMNVYLHPLPAVCGLLLGSEGTGVRLTFRSCTGLGEYEVCVVRRNTSQPLPESAVSARKCSVASLSVVVWPSESCLCGTVKYGATASRVFCCLCV